MKVAILGANGALGKYLAGNLPNFDISPIVRSDLDLLNFQNVTNFFTKNKFDAVINCAIDQNIDLNNFNPNVLSNNLLMFTNLHSCRHLFGKLINFGSGAEFDRTSSIDRAKEEDIFTHIPNDHYGMSKNICSRISYTTENFYTFRLFGAFFSNEPNRRLLQKILSGIPLEIEDRYFDYFWMGDSIPAIQKCLLHGNIHKDINLVYPDKLLLSEFIDIFCTVKKIKPTIKWKTGKNYTGSAERLCELGINFTPLTKIFENYI